MVHVCHITGKGSYKGVGTIDHYINDKNQTLHDKKNSEQKLEREAKKRYDIEKTGDTRKPLTK